MQHVQFPRGTFDIARLDRVFLFEFFSFIPLTNVAKTRILDSKTSLGQNGDRKRRSMTKKRIAGKGSIEGPPLGHSLEANPNRSKPKSGPLERLIGRRINNRFSCLPTTIKFPQTRNNSLGPTSQFRFTLAVPTHANRVRTMTH